MPSGETTESETSPDFGWVTVMRLRTSRTLVVVGAWAAETTSEAEMPVALLSVMVVLGLGAPVMEMIESSTVRSLKFTAVAMPVLKTRTESMAVLLEASVPVRV